MTVPTETRPAGAGVLGDDGGAVRGHLGDGEAGVLEARAPRGRRRSCPPWPGCRTR